MSATSSADIEIDGVPGFGAGGAYVSALEMFSIGIGPSSSHTVGPMRIGHDFARRVLAEGRPLARLQAVLCGSLAATGLGHGTPDALVAGLRGLEPETCDPSDVAGSWSRHTDGANLWLEGSAPVAFDRKDLLFRPDAADLPHPNTAILRAWDRESGGRGQPTWEETYFSIGGGFITRQGEAPVPVSEASPGPCFRSASELLALCGTGASIADVAWRAEVQRRSAAEVESGLDAIWAAMTSCIDAGLTATGPLPGFLRVPRRAAGVREKLEAAPADDPWTAEGWMHVYALAVSEENAGGGRVVTAPTNGAAGVIPAVLMQWTRRAPSEQHGAGVRTFLLTAAAIGSLIKANASISGAEGGCQAEVGSACAMAAAGLCAVLGGTPAQVENAAEIAVEHHLGLTCDPIGGLVQIPCIERNAIAATTAVAAAHLALAGNGSHIVSLDAVIETMRQTGLDMSDKYKETSRGGLAVNVVEC